MVHISPAYRHLFGNPGKSPLQTNINLSTQSFIPAAVTHTTMSSTLEQRIPKSLNGERVKNNRQQGRSNAQDEQLCFHCKQPGHLKKDCPEQPYCSKYRTKGHIPAKCPAKNCKVLLPVSSRVVHKIYCTTLGNIVRVYPWIVQGLTFLSA